MKREWVKNIILSAFSLAAVWIVWAIAYRAVGNDYVLPSFRATFSEMGRLLGEASFWRAFGNTLLRTLWAFLLSFALGLAFALLSALSGAARAFLFPILSALRTAPTMALVLVLLLWTSPAAAPVIIAALVLFPAFYAAMLASLDAVKADYGGLLRAFGVGLGRRIGKVYLPLAAPPVLAQTGAMFSLGLKITVSGEVLSATAASLGGMMQHAQAFLEMPRLLALTLLAILLGFLFEGLFFFLGKLLGRRFG